MSNSEVLNQLLGQNSEIKIDDFAKMLLDLCKSKVNSLNTLNIIVAGKTGVGKSTLINSIFKERLAETGVGVPTTQHITKLKKPGVPLVLYDTRGLELGKEAQEEVKQEVMDAIRDGLDKQDINQTIHCILYCINTASNRVEPEEIKWLRELSEENKTTNVPIIIVLTQSFNKQNAETIKNTLRTENLNVRQIVPVLAEDYEIDGLGTISSFGLDTLVDVIGEVIPDELQHTLQNIQIVSLEAKKRYARAIVAGAVTAAMGEAVVPIPLADSAMLIPTQLAMLAGITTVFGLEINKSVLAPILSATLGVGGATIVGKTVFTNIIKFVPGIGSLIGGCIAAATAGAITDALGSAYIKIMEAIFKGEMSKDDLATEAGKEKMKAFFKDELKKRKN